MAHNPGRVALKRCADPRYFGGVLERGLKLILEREGLTDPASHFTLAGFGGLSQFVDETLLPALTAELKIAAHHGVRKLVALGHEDCARIKDLLGDRWSCEAEKELLARAARIGQGKCQELGIPLLRAYYQAQDGEVYLYNMKADSFITLHEADVRSRR